jgi:hypothetical protein
LSDAWRIYARRGTRWALQRVLEIYVGGQPEIIDLGEGLEPFTFTVRLPVPRDQVNETLITQVINANIPAHTAYQLEFMS